MGEHVQLRIEEAYLVWTDCFKRSQLAEEVVLP